MPIVTKTTGAVGMLSSTRYSKIGKIIKILKLKIKSQETLVSKQKITLTEYIISYLDFDMVFICYFFHLVILPLKITVFTWFIILQIKIKLGFCLSLAIWWSQFPLLPKQREWLVGLPFCLYRAGTYYLQHLLARRSRLLNCTDLLRHSRMSRLQFHVILTFNEMIIVSNGSHLIRKLWFKSF